MRKAYEEDSLPCFEVEGEGTVKSREIFNDLSAADSFQPKRTEKSENEQYRMQQYLHGEGRAGETREKKTGSRNDV